MQSVAASVLIATSIAVVPACAADRAPIVLPGWSFTAMQNDQPLLNLNTVPSNTGTFADALVKGLASYGIGYERSAVLLGRNIGHGFSLYIGETSRFSREGAPSSAAFGGGEGFGIEYTVHF